MSDISDLIVASTASFTRLLFQFSVGFSLPGNFHVCVNQQMVWSFFRSPVWKDGSTAVTALVVDDVLYVANLGDSRVMIQVRVVN